jgi:hypothetical protein
MRRVVQKLLRVALSAVLISALFGVVAIDAVNAGAPCPPAAQTAHEGHHHHDGNQSTPDKTMPDCFKCCFTCQIPPSLTAGPVAAVAVPIVGVALYWAHDGALTGRSIPPDPAPPRPIA